MPSQGTRAVTMPVWSYVSVATPNMASVRYLVRRRHHVFAYARIGGHVCVGGCCCGSERLQVCVCLRFAVHVCIKQRQ